ncbi:MAG: hypothetical protein HPY64_15995 [Anaerolineae bacterium]|nr:hypothetical protein [Anaerolineae bacterium]
MWILRLSEQQGQELASVLIDFFTYEVLETVIEQLEDNLFPDVRLELCGAGSMEVGATRSQRVTVSYLPDNMREPPLYLIDPAIPANPAVTVPISVHPEPLEIALYKTVTRDVALRALLDFFFTGEIPRDLLWKSYWEDRESPDAGDETGANPDLPGST